MSLKPFCQFMAEIMPLMNGPFNYAYVCINMIILLYIHIIWSKSNQSPHALHMTAVSVRKLSCEV